MTNHFRPLSSLLLPLLVPATPPTRLSRTYLMCIILLSIPPPSSEYLLILGSNRDEYLARPTLNAGWNEFPSGSNEDPGKILRGQRPRVTEDERVEGIRASLSGDPNGRWLGGRDLKAGGTWLALTQSTCALSTSVPRHPSSSSTRTASSNSNSKARSNSNPIPPGTPQFTTLRITGLTNIHDPPTSSSSSQAQAQGNTGKKSRGDLVLDSLRSLHPRPRSVEVQGTGSRADVPSSGQHDDDEQEEKKKSSIDLESIPLYSSFNLLEIDLIFPPSSPISTLKASEPRISIRVMSNRTEPPVTLIPLPPYTSNSDKDPLGDQTRERGMTFGLSNSVVDEPFEKVLKGCERLGEVLPERWSGGEEGDEGDGEEAQERLVKRMFGLLAESVHERLTGFQDLQRNISIPLAFMPLDTPTSSSDPSTVPSIDTPDPNSGKNAYGTRTSTVILVRRTGEVVYVERDRLWLDEKGEVRSGGTEDRRVSFTVG